MQNNKKKTVDKATKGGQQIVDYRLPLGKANFVIMGIAALMIIVGFALISGGGTDDGSFNPEIFNTTRIVIGPTMAFLGFIGIGAGLIWKGKKNGHD